MVAAIHIGVGSDVVCSTKMGNARASTRGTVNRKFHAFLCSSAGFSLGCSKVMSMNVVKQSFGDVTTLGGDTCPPCTGLTPDALPEVQMPVMAEDLQSGVSARSDLSGTVS